MEKLTIISEKPYKDLPWTGIALAERLQLILQDLKPGLEVSKVSLEHAMDSAQSHFFFMLKEADGKEPELAGYAELLEWASATGSAGYIENVVVRKDLQGKRIGSRLLGALLEKAQERHLSTLWLHSGRWREAAQKLYQANGFQEKDTVILFRQFT